MLGFSIGEFCSQTKDILQFIGYILTIVKIAIPLLIISFGIFDLGKAVTSGKDDETKKAAKSLMWRAISGVFIFFIPSLVIWLFGTVNDYSEAWNADNQGFKTCQECILYPWNCN